MDWWADEEDAAAVPLDFKETAQTHHRRNTMNRVILADDQAIFRAGAARVLALEDDMRIVAQCADAPRLRAAVAGFGSAIVLFSSAVAPDISEMIALLAGASSFGVIITEKGEAVAEANLKRLNGCINRSITGPELIECVRRVGRGQRAVQRANVTTMQAQDTVGARVRDRLTPKEMQIVALIVQGRKNKDIAYQLNTKEQVIKNYLRSIYDKIGVSDRLELALFTLHHTVLAEAAHKAGAMIQMKSA
jgi:DNA-binding NarL/FixJ family response regulator